VLATLGLTVPSGLPLPSLLHWWHSLCAQDTHVPALNDLTHTNLEGQGAATLIRAVKHTAIAGQTPGVVAPAQRAWWTRASHACSNGWWLIKAGPIMARGCAPSKLVGGTLLCPLLPQRPWNKGGTTTRQNCPARHRAVRIVYPWHGRCATGTAGLLVVSCRPAAETKSTAHTLPLAGTRSFQCIFAPTPDERPLGWLRPISFLDVTELQTTGGAGQLTGGCCLGRLSWQAGSGSTQEGHSAQQLAAGSSVISCCCCCCCWQGMQLLGTHRRCNCGAQGLRYGVRVCCG
jgi:hypothetical protein